MPNATCIHNTPQASKRLCFHLLHDREADHYQRFTGQGMAHDLICTACAERLAGYEKAKSTEDIERFDRTLCVVCDACFSETDEEGFCDGILGRPGVLERQTSLRLEHRELDLSHLAIGALVGVAPLLGDTQGAWIALTQAGKLLRLDLTLAQVETLAELPLDTDKPVSLTLSGNGRFAAVCQTFDRHGMVVDLDDGRLCMTLDRGDYHVDVTPFAVAFFEDEGNTYIVHATDWNRLDIAEPASGRCLSERGPTRYRRGEERPGHYLDYFHGRLRVSPDQRWIVDDGWVWHPFGVVSVWDLRRWHRDNVWESEDGPSRKSVCARAYFWNGPMCWIDNHTLAVWGYGDDDEAMLPAVTLFDVEREEELSWFAGPEVEADKGKPWHERPGGELVFDEYLFSLSGKHGTAVWDIQTGERLLHDPGFSPTAYHAGVHQFLSVLPDQRFRISTLVDDA